MTRTAAIYAGAINYARVPRAGRNAYAPSEIDAFIVVSVTYDTINELSRRRRVAELKCRLYSRVDHRASKFTRSLHARNTFRDDTLYGYFNLSILDDLFLSQAPYSHISPRAIIVLSA